MCHVAHTSYHSSPEVRKKHWVRTVLVLGDSLGTPGAATGMISNNGAALRRMDSVEFVPPQWCRSNLDTTRILRMPNIETFFQ